MNIFVSYTTRDYFITKDYLREIDKIISQNANSFIDLLHNNSNEKQRFLEQKLLNSDVILLISSISVHFSPWVAWEIKLAENKGIPVVRVFVEKNQLSSSLIEIQKIVSNILSQ